jgi:transposase-like protein
MILTEWLDEQACYEWLLKILDPGGLACPNGYALPKGQPLTNRAAFGASAGVIAKYKCRECGKVFHIFTEPDLSGSHYNCQTIVPLRGIIQGQSTQHIAIPCGLR